MSSFIARALPFFISPDQHSIRGDALLYQPPVPVVVLEPFPVFEGTEMWLANVNTIKQALVGCS